MPTVPPAKFSLVLQDGSDGYACFVSGNYLVTEATDVTAGYTDGEHMCYWSLLKENL
jgi:hypothetical protein